MQFEELKFKCSTTVRTHRKLQLILCPRTFSKRLSLADHIVQPPSFQLLPNPSKWYVYRLQTIQPTGAGLLFPSFCRQAASRKFQLVLQPSTPIVQRPANIFVFSLWPVHHDPLHQVPRAAARPRARAARQGRGQDEERHLPARVERQGAQRGQGACRRPRRAGHERQEAAHGCFER